MDYETAKQRLNNHANLPNTGLPMEDSFVGRLWLAGKGEAVLCVAEHVEDVLACLSVVNTHFNGSDPNTRSGPADHSRISEVAYALSGIISGGISCHRISMNMRRFSADDLLTLEKGVDKIAYAWDQVLASDVTDLLEGFDLFE